MSRRLLRFQGLLDEIKSALSISKRFEIDKVGVLFLDPANNICFKPSSTNFLINSFGLPIVKAIPLEREKESVSELPAKEPKVKPLEIIHDKDKLPAIQKEDEVIPISADREICKSQEILVGSSSDNSNSVLFCMDSYENGFVKWRK